MSVDDDEDEKEMLRKAIALSLEEETGVNFAKRENKAEHNYFQVARSQRQRLRMMMLMRRRCWRRPSPSPWKSKQVRFYRKKGKAEYLQKKQISGLSRRNWTTVWRRC